MDPRVSSAIASVLLLALLYATASRIGHGSAAEGEDTPGFTLPSRGVVLLAVLCLLVMVTEGAMADWGGLYLRQDLGASAALAALAYSFFTAGMTVGRVVGDCGQPPHRAVALLRWGALLTGVPLAAMLLIGQPAAALAGLFLVGLGVANGVPLMFSAAGRQPDTPPGPGIAAVSSMGSLGFLAGPPVIGFLADATSLPWALATLILGAVVVFALARRATGRAQPERGERGAPAPDPVAVHELRRRDLRLRRRARGLDRRHRPRLGALGRPARDRRRRDPGREPRPAGACRRRRARGAGAGRGRGGVAARGRGRRHRRASSRYPGAADVLALPVVAIATSCAHAARPRAARAPPGSSPPACS